jgi:transcriptional regulator with XRE-family HTH domain
MEEIEGQNGVGQRIRALRKSRGIKSTADLAALIPGNLLSGAVLRNIEVGVRSDLSVSELLNIARALNVAPIYLLAPIRQPDAHLDLPNLSDDLNQMTAIEFDEWLSGSSDWIQEWTTVEDQSERNQLRAMRELERQAKERDRLTSLLDLSPELQTASSQSLDSAQADVLSIRWTEALRRIELLSHYLQTAGWDVRRWQQGENM